MSLSKFVILLLVGGGVAQAQELFPVNEPASTMPAKVIGVRLTTHLHSKYQVVGHREMLRVMYGINRAVTTMATVSVSNFHVRAFPEDLNEYYQIAHNHKSGSSNYPYRLEGMHLLTKWRILSLDHAKEHFRISIVNEFSYNKAVHLDAYPGLIGDQPGGSLGFIATKLKRRLAVSLTGAVSKFFSHTDKSGVDAVNFKAGNSLNLNISTGYLIYPKVYNSYNDVNVNLYLEANSKFFESPRVYRSNILLNTDQFPYLKNGSVVNLYPAVQFIFNSVTRVDLGMELPLLTSNSAARYSMLVVNVQRYFF